MSDICYCRGSGISQVYLPQHICHDEAHNYSKYTDMYLLFALEDTQSLKTHAIRLHPNRGEDVSALKEAMDSMRKFQFAALKCPFVSVRPNMEV